jgi:hypothetical protein
MRACKNAVSAQRPNVPLAYIQVDSPRSNGGSQLSNFRIQPPNGPWSAGSCDVFRNGRVNVTFTGGGNNNGGNSDGYGNGGYGGGASTPQTVQQLCNDAASAHLPGVPLAYIDTYRGSDTGDGSYMINFRAQPRGRPNFSGFCIISKRGQLERFEYDPGAGPGNGGNYGGGNNSGGGDPHNAALLCKNGVSAQWPNTSRSIRPASTEAACSPPSACSRRDDPPPAAPAINIQYNR